MRLPKSFIVVLEDIAVADCIAAADCIVEVGRIAEVAVERIAVAVACIAVVGRIVVEVEHIVEVGRIVAVERKSVAWRKIERRIVEPPADSFEVSPAAKYFVRVRDRLEPVARLEKYSSRALSAVRKLDLHSGRRLPAVAWNFAASAPLSRLPAVALDLKPSVTFHAP